MSVEPLKRIVHPATAKHSATIIFIHGLGDTGNGWKPVAEMMSSKIPHVKWILPTARIQPVSLNMGMRMNSWFDILSLDPEDSVGEDEKGILQSVYEINKIITEEVDSGIPADRIVVGGFSQGGVVSLLTGLTNERKLAGIVVLSGFLGIREKAKAMLGPHTKKLPIFMGHGTGDQVVPYKFGSLSHEYLTEKLKIPRAEEIGSTGVTFKTYAGLPHSVNEKELDDVAQWLLKVIPQE